MWFAIFNTNNRKGRHILHAHTMSCFTCPVCLRQFASYFDVVQHRDYCNDKTNCAFCNEVARLPEHTMECRMIPICPICNKKHPFSVCEVYSCNKCNLVFGSKDSLGIHLQTHNPRCLKCNRTYRTSRGLAQHNRYCSTN